MSVLRVTPVSPCFKAGHDTQWIEDNLHGINTDSYYVNDPFILLGPEDVKENLFDSSQAMMKNIDPQDDVDVIRMFLTSVRTSFNDLVESLIYFSSMRGVTSQHVSIVTNYTDYMRQLAAHADAVATGAVRSSFELRGAAVECPNSEEEGLLSLISLNETLFSQWKLGPFNTTPVHGPDPTDTADVETFVGDAISAGAETLQAVQRAYASAADSGC